MDDNLLECFTRPDCYSRPAECVPLSVADGSAVVEQHCSEVALLPSAFEAPVAVAIQPNGLGVPSLFAVAAAVAIQPSALDVSRLLDHD